MNNVYDNGAIMIGNIDLVINEIKREIDEDLDMLFIDREELLKELEELKRDIKDIELIYIDYESCSSNYILNYFTKRDLIF